MNYQSCLCWTPLIARFLFALSYLFTTFTWITWMWWWVERLSDHCNRKPMVAVWCKWLYRGCCLEPMVYAISSKSVANVSVKSRNQLECFEKSWPETHSDRACTNTHAYTRERVNMQCRLFDNNRAEEQNRSSMLDLKYLVRPQHL